MKAFRSAFVLTIPLLYTQGCGHEIYGALKGIERDIAADEQHAVAVEVTADKYASALFADYEKKPDEIPPRLATLIRIAHKDKNPDEKAAQDIAQILLTDFGVRIEGYSENWEVSRATRTKDGKLLGPTIETPIVLEQYRKKVPTHFNAYFLAQLYMALTNRKPHLEVPILLKPTDGIDMNSTLLLEKDAHSKGAWSMPVQVNKYMSDLHPRQSAQKMREDIAKLISSLDKEIYVDPHAEKKKVKTEWFPGYMRNAFHLQVQVKDKTDPNGFIRGSSEEEKRDLLTTLENFPRYMFHHMEPESNALYNPEKAPPLVDLQYMLLTRQDVSEDGLLYDPKSKALFMSTRSLNALDPSKDKSKDKSRANRISADEQVARKFAEMAIGSLPEAEQKELRNALFVERRDPLGHLSYDKKPGTPEFLFKDSSIGDWKKAVADYATLYYSRPDQYHEMSMRLREQAPEIAKKVEHVVQNRIFNKYNFQRMTVAKQGEVYVDSKVEDTSAPEWKDGEISYEVVQVGDKWHVYMKIDGLMDPKNKDGTEGSGVDQVTVQFGNTVRGAKSHTVILANEKRDQKTDGSEKVFFGTYDDKDEPGVGDLAQKYGSPALVLDDIDAISLHAPTQVTVADKHGLTKTYTFNFEGQDAMDLRKRVVEKKYQLANAPSAADVLDGKADAVLKTFEGNNKTKLEVLTKHDKDLGKFETVKVSFKYDPKELRITKQEAKGASKDSTELFNVELPVGTENFPDSFEHISLRFRDDKTNQEFSVTVPNQAIVKPYSPNSTRFNFGIDRAHNRSGSYRLEYISYKAKIKGSEKTSSGSLPVSRHLPNHVIQHENILGHNQRSFDFDGTRGFFAFNEEEEGDYSKSYVFSEGKKHMVKFILPLREGVEQPSPDQNAYLDGQFELLSPTTLIQQRVTSENKFITVEVDGKKLRALEIPIELPPQFVGGRYVVKGFEYSTKSRGLGEEERKNFVRDNFALLANGDSYLREKTKLSEIVVNVGNKAELLKEQK